MESEKCWPCGRWGLPYSPAGNALSKWHLNSMSVCALWPFRRRSPQRAATHWPSPLRRVATVTPRALPAGVLFVLWLKTCTESTSGSSGVGPCLLRTLFTFQQLERVSVACRRTHHNLVPINGWIRLEPGAWPPFGAELYFWLHRPPSGRQHWGQKSRGRHPGQLEGSGSARQWIYDRLHPWWASISLERKQTHKCDAVWWAARMKLTGWDTFSSVRRELNGLLFPHRPAG